MADVAASQAEVPDERSSPLRETFGALGAVFRNPGLRKVQLALAGSMIGDWAYATAVAVWAYGVGGATAVGVWSAVRLTLLAFSSPLGATLADRLPRKRVMIGADLIRVGLVGAAAACLLLGLPAAAVFVLATLTALVGTAFRPAQRALMPSLATRPEELTASNGTSSTLESLAFFLGPALGALLIAVADVPVVFLLNAATFVWSAVLLLGLRVPAHDGEGGPQATDRAAAAGDPGAADVTGEPDTPGGGFLGETLAGFRVIVGDKDLFVVTAEVAAQTVVAGASAVFTVVMAVSILETGPKGVGFLDSALGVGAILGGFFAISRAAKRRLATDMTTGVVLWSLPLLLVVAWPHPASAFAAVVLLGFANPLVDVNMETIVQRIVPDEVLGRVFGALEACLIGTMALGALVMPLLDSWLGLRAALAVVGVGVAAVALAGLPRMRMLDRRLGAPAGLDRLRGIAMFTPLTPATLESVARALAPVHVPAGQVVLREGEDSDRFYVIEAGLVEVTQQGAVLRREAPGDFFGEIGLLRDVPRTATITAVEDTDLWALDRDDFLAAVTGQREARLAADEVVSRRLTV